MSFLSFWVTIMVLFDVFSKPLFGLPGYLPGYSLFWQWQLPGRALVDDLDGKFLAMRLMVHQPVE